jgi:hypothetical protein
MNDAFKIIKILKLLKDTYSNQTDFINPESHVAVLLMKKQMA